MTLTPHRDAVDQTVAATRERYAEVMARNDAAGIGQRMSIETCEAILGGMADMLDRGVALEKVWPQIAMAEAGALASFLLSAAHGDAAAAERLLPGALASIQELALARLRRKPEEWVVGTSVAPRSAGQG